MKFKLPRHVSLTAVDDDAVLLDLNSGAYFGLNHIGASLLDQLQQGISVELAIENIAKQYQISNDIVAQDIQELLSELIDQALIEPI